jgi:hypothetical protein
VRRFTRQLKRDAQVFEYDQNLWIILRIAIYRETAPILNRIGIMLGD